MRASLKATILEMQGGPDASASRFFEVDADIPARAWAHVLASRSELFGEPR